MERRPTKRRATYQDVLDAPEYNVAELVRGDLWLSPRPGCPATAVASALCLTLEPFDADGDGCGGWVILIEPELHLGDEVVVPDLAAWRVERMPTVPEAAAFTIPPDWICEVLSQSTEQLDRTEKMAIYAEHGIEYAWLIQPRRRILEAYRRQARSWATLVVHTSLGRARIAPFDAIELDLARLWARVAPPNRASESYELDGP